MPIPLTALIREQIIPHILTPANTVAELLYLCDEQPQPRWCYALVRINADTYDVLMPDDLNEAAMQYQAALLALPLSGLPGLLKPAQSVQQDQIGEDAAMRRMGATPRRRLVVLGATGEVVGILAATNLGVPKGLLSALDLIEQPVALESLGDSPQVPAYLNTRFDGLGPNQPLAVGRRTPLIIWVGPPAATNLNWSNRPFAFDFAGSNRPVVFTVHVDADPEDWTIKAVEPTMIVAPPGMTTQEAEFLITARRATRDKLHISVEHAATGATVQHVWLPVVAEAESAGPSPVPPAIERTTVDIPLDTTGLQRRSVEITIQPGEESFKAIVRADLASGVVRETYTVPISGDEIQNAALRLREELTKIVLYEVQEDGWPIHPFFDLRIDEGLARRLVVPLADAGEQVWRMLFNAPHAPDDLKRLAADIRAMPHGSSVQIVLESRRFIVPWALLYDKPGPITAETLDWAGFWGYRYILNALPPGRYPDPAINDAPPGVQLLFNDDFGLGRFTVLQQSFLKHDLSSARGSVATGDIEVQRALTQPGDAALVYFYCHGDHHSGATAPGRLASESALYFSGGKPVRLADLRRLPVAPLARRPLVFLNACEGATQDAFYYDGFMPYFIEELGACGFIGTEVKAPQLLAHDLALQFLRAFAEGRPVGEILWRLRQHYLDTCHNILAFNYSLYALGEVRLARPLLVSVSPPASDPPPSH